MIQPSEFFKRDEMSEAQKARLIQAVDNSELDYDEVVTMVDNASQFMNGSIVPDRGKLPYEPWEEEFIESFREMQKHIHQIAQAKGWLGPDGKLVRDRNDVMMHIVSELGEIYRSHHDGDPQSSKIPWLKSSEEEWVDVLILAMSATYALGVNAAEGIVAKSRYNMTRPYRHGKCF